jgi:hypothetical protein
MGVQHKFVSAAFEGQFGVQPSQGQVNFLLSILNDCGGPDGFLADLSVMHLTEIAELSDFDLQCVTEPERVAADLEKKQNAVGPLSVLGHSLKGSNSQFVEAAYAFCLARPVDEEGRDAYCRHLALGMPRMAVVLALLQSSESLNLSVAVGGQRSRETHDALRLALLSRGEWAVEHLFGLVVCRQPNADELLTWAGRCVQEPGVFELCEVLLASLEFGLLVQSVAQQHAQLARNRDRVSGLLTRRWRRWWPKVFPRVPLATGSASGHGKKVLLLCTFPIDQPRHGGQHRVLNIIKAYEGAGFDVVLGGVLGGDHYPSARRFLPFPGFNALSRYIDNPFLMDDWAIGQMYATDDEAFASLAAQFDFVPDLVHVELPWLYRFARRFLGRFSGRPIPLVYGSENVEHQLKHGIVKTYMGDEWASHCQDLVLAAELEAIEGADGVCVVSAHDQEWTTQRSRVPVVLAPNGVTRRPLTAAGIKAALELTQHRKFALYCASGHPPNVVGFYDIFEQGVGCLPPDTRLVVAGSAGKAIVNDSRFGRTAALGRLMVAGHEVSEECLQALLHMAHAVVLPITHGGGTNLKTAEAIWAGRHVVATPVAMRGFESFEGHAGVAVAGDARHFKELLRQAMDAPPLEVDSAECKRRECVLWDHTLEPLMVLACDLLDVNAGRTA